MSSTLIINNNYVTPVENCRNGETSIGFSESKPGKDWVIPNNMSQVQNRSFSKTTVGPFWEKIGGSINISEPSQNMKHGPLRIDYRPIYCK